MLGLDVRTNHVWPWLIGDWGLCIALGDAVGELPTARNDFGKAGGIENRDWSLVARVCK